MSIDVGQSGKLLAVQYLLDGCREYFPGDTVPAPAPEGWLENGAVILVKDQQPPAGKARPAAATPGMPGLAVGGEATGNELVGKVPETPQRKRKRK